MKDVTTLARSEDAQAETWQLVIPDDVVLLPWLGGIDEPLSELSHANFPDRTRILA